MKRMKALKGALIGVFVVAAACCVFAACGSDSDEDDDLDVEIEYIPIDNSSIVSMTLDDSSVKKTYLTYQSFSSEGLEATATRESGAVEVISASDLDVDYSDFNSAKAGEYVIKVSYVENEYSFETSYDVEVIEEIAGLTVTKERVDYVVGDADGDGKVDTDNTATTATISLEDLRVYAVTADEEEPISETTYYDEEVDPDDDGALDSGDYELKFFKGGEEFSSLEGLRSGIYTIYVYRDITITGKYSTIQYECGAYILCYVTDKVSSIELNVDEDETPIGTFEQELGAYDLMSSTWSFTLTYESGATEQITADDVQIEGLYPSMPSPNGATATVTYTEAFVTSSERGVWTVTVENGVTYYVSLPEGGVTLDYSLDIDALQTAVGGSGEHLTAAAFSGDNAFLTYNYNSSSDEVVKDGYMGLKSGSIDVTFYGTGFISITFKSTGNNSSSSLALKNSSNQYVKGTIETYSDDISEESDSNGYVYVASNTTECTVTFEITNSGKYTVCANMRYGNTSASGKAVRITAIKMQDVITDGDSAGGTVSLLENTLAFVADFNFEEIDLSLPDNPASSVYGLGSASKAED